MRRKSGSTWWKLAGVMAAYCAYRIAVAARRRFDFFDRTVVITGGARGLGLVLARHLADQGARLAICSRCHAELERAAGELRGRGAEVVARVCDVTDAADVERFFDHVRRELGTVDVLINNAGIIQVGPLDVMNDADFSEAMATHCWGPLQTMRHAIPDMRRRGFGRIVNIASIGGLVSVPHLAPYCASKFALVALSDGFRAELAREGVYVTTVCPGLMRTGSHVRAWFKGDYRREYAWFSLGASAPLVSMSAERAARQIIRACRIGRARATLSIPAKLAAAANTVAPELTADLNSLVAACLPNSRGAQSGRVEGRDAASAWSPSLATAMGDRAAARNNELA